MNRRVNRWRRVVDNGTRDRETQGPDFSSPLMSAPKKSPPDAPRHSGDPALASTFALTPSSMPCSPVHPAKVRSLDTLMLSLTLDLQASKFKPPKSFASVRRDPPSSSTQALPSKRLSSDPETPPPSSAIQAKRPRCHTGNEKENRFSQEIPLAGVTNLVHRPTPASSQKKLVECIDVDDDLPSSSGHPSGITREFWGVSWVEKGSLARTEYP